MAGKKKIYTQDDQSMRISENDLEILRTHSGISSEILEKLERTKKQLKVTAEEFKEISDALDNWDEGIYELGIGIRQVLDELRGRGPEAKQYRDITKEISKNYEKMSSFDLSNIENVNFNKLNNALLDAKDNLKNMRELYQDFSDQISKETADKAMRAAESNLDKLEKAKKTLMDFQKNMDTISRKSSPSTLLVGGLSKIFQKIPGLDTFGRDLEENLRETKIRLAKEGATGFWKVNKAVLEVLKNTIKENGAISKWTIGLGLALGFVRNIWKAFLDVNAASVNLQRETGRISIGAAASNSAFATSVDWLNMAVALSKELHIDPQVLFTTDEIAKLAEAKNFLNLSDTELASLGVRAKGVGSTFETYSDSITEGYRTTLKANNVEGSRYKTAVSLSEVMRGVANTSNTILLSMKNNGTAIAEAVTQAKTLGMELKDIDNIAASLIHFQSSISAEMEAQLLTGQNLNLAQARQYALTNDYIGLMEELKNQGITVEAYMNMNRIQQEAIAKALGMSRDQMSNMLYEQVKSAGYSDHQLATLLGITDEELRARSITDEWNTSIQKLTQAFTPVLKVVADIVEGITWAIAQVAGLVGMGTKGAANVEVSGLAKVAGVTGVTALGVGILTKTWKGIGKVGTLFKRNAVKDLHEVVDAANEAGKANVKGLSNLGSTLGKFFENLGSNEVLKGVLAVAGIAGAFWILGKAVQNFVGIDWKTLGIAGAALGGLTAVVITLGLLGNAMTSVLPGLALFAGVAAIVSGSVWVLGQAIQSFVTPLQEMQDLNVLGTLSSLALGITELGLAGIFALPGFMGITLMGVALKSLTTPLTEISEALSGVNEAMSNLPDWRANIEGLRANIGGLNTSLDDLDIGKLRNLGEVTRENAVVQQETTIQYTSNLERIENKMDELIGTVRGIDWNWLEFDKTYRKSIYT